MKPKQEYVFHPIILKREVLTNVTFSG